MWWHLSPSPQYFLLYIPPSTPLKGHTIPSIISLLNSKISARGQARGASRRVGESCIRPLLIPSSGGPLLIPSSGGHLLVGKQVWKFNMKRVKKYPNWRREVAMQWWQSCLIQTSTEQFRIVIFNPELHNLIKKNCQCQTWAINHNYIRKIVLSSKYYPIIISTIIKKPKRREPTSLPIKNLSLTLEKEKKSHSFIAYTIHSHFYFVLLHSICYSQGVSLFCLSRNSIQEISKIHL